MMKVDNCPKGLHQCNEMCPEHPCWAHDQYLEKAESEHKKMNDGWE